VSREKRKERRKGTFILFRLKEKAARGWRKKGGKVVVVGYVEERKKGR